MNIVIASGKGGTGKTTIATNLALTLATNGENVQLLDADVEAPNCHLFIDPNIEKELPVNLLVPEVDESLCTLCGKCSDICEYNAIAVFGKSTLVFPELCHACGGCKIVCPENAIMEIEHKTGIIQIGRAGQLGYVAGRLAIGEAKAPPIIRDVKKHLLTDGINIIDSPPGTSCPVVESLKNADYAVLVTEPTPFGYNDLVLAVEVVRKMEIPFGIIINRSDIGDDRVEKYCQVNNIPVLMSIPEDRAIAKAYSSGEMLIKAIPEWKEKFSALGELLKRVISG